MERNYEKLFDAVEKYKDLILAAERQIWNNPESGYKEWKTHKYLKEKYEELGYSLVEAGNIPGFYTEIDTGKPGPTVAIFGEMDSLVINTHEECDKETGAVHACGHNCQCAAVLGVAAALKEPGALDGLCGKIRLYAVPSEEEIELEFRSELIKQGVIKYPAGKQEFLYRGYLDGVDMSFMVHTTSRQDSCIFSGMGSNGCILKTAVFKGKSSHAGGAPYNGINALYAATNAMSVANALRETFKDEENVRFHPIITAGGDAVNAIPSTVKVESYIRAATMEAMKRENDKVNRAFAGVAASMGCELELHDMHGMAPRSYDKTFLKAYYDVCTMLFDESKIIFTDHIGGGCSDMGDVSMLMPIIHPNCAGATGFGHSENFRITDPYLACVQSAKTQVGTLYKILSNDAEIAKTILKDFKPTFKTKEDYFKVVDNITADINAVTYNPDNTATVKYVK